MINLQRSLGDKRCLCFTYKHVRVSRVWLAILLTNHYFNRCEMYTYINIWYNRPISRYECSENQKSNTHTKYTEQNRLLLHYLTWADHLQRMSIHPRLSCFSLFKHSQIFQQPIFIRRECLRPQFLLDVSKTLNGMNKLFCRFVEEYIWMKTNMFSNLLTKHHFAFKTILLFNHNNTTITENININWCENAKTRVLEYRLPIGRVLEYRLPIGLHVI